MVRTRLQMNVDRRSLSPYFKTYLSVLLGVEADDSYICFSVGAWRRMAAKANSPRYQIELDQLHSFIGSLSDDSLLCFTSNPNLFP